MADRTDPLPEYNFIVEIDGLALGGFQEVSGLESDIDVIEYREGADKGLIHRKIPGKVKYPNIVLKVGLTQSTALYDWHKEWVTAAATAKRKLVRIVLLDRAGNEKRAWKLREAWPSRWVGPTLNALVSGIAVDTFELTHEGIEAE